MNENKPDHANLDDLRRQAESLVKRLSLNQTDKTVSADEMQKLMHELLVYQAELEIQNEELRRAQRELEESRDKYADLYDFAPVGYFTLDQTGMILDANLTGAALVNRERRALMKANFVNLVSKEYQSTFLSHLVKVFETKMRETCEIQLERRGPNRVHVRLESIALWTSENQPSACRAAVSDITELKHEEAEVLRTQERVLSSMAEGVCVCNERGLITFTNPAFDAMFGRDRSGFLGKSLDQFGSFLVEDNPLSFTEILDQVMEQGHWHGEVRCRKRNGMIFDARGRVTVLQDLGQRSLIAVWEDITAVKQAERALRESEERLRAIFDCATDMIFMKDSGLTYTLVNSAFERLVDRPATSIIGLHYEDLFGREHAAYQADVDARVLAGQTIEGAFTRKVHGVPRRLHEVRVPLRDQDGKVIGICGILRDITDQRQMAPGPPKEPEGTKSKGMQSTRALALLAAKRDSVVLLKGETGSGKDYLARYIHDNSGRAGRPYFCINCGAVPEGLAESELFGHERGAFTGAQARKRGLLELAEGGTLLLNEIGELTLPLQTKLLTFLDTRKITRVGGEKEIAVNARLIAATNRDLAKDAEAGRFRKDLFYRLSVMTIEIPPLRERVEDIPAIAQSIIATLTDELQLPHAPEIPPETMEVLKSYHWPGNVRELRNVLERAMILGEGKHLHFLLPLTAADTEDLVSKSEFFGRSLRDVTDEITRAMCVDALQRARGNRKEAAKLLGIARDSLYRYMKQFGIEEAASANSSSSKK